jgi:hypothetical protein
VCATIMRGILLRVAADPIHSTVKLIDKSLGSAPAAFRVQSVAASASSSAAGWTRSDSMLNRPAAREAAYSQRAMR